MSEPRLIENVLAVVFTPSAISLINLSCDCPALRLIRHLLESLLDEHPEDIGILAVLLRGLPDLLRWRQPLCLPKPIAFDRPIEYPRQLEHQLGLEKLVSDLQVVALRLLRVFLELYEKWDHQRAPPYPLIRPADHGLMIGREPQLEDRGKRDGMLVFVGGRYRIAARNLFDQSLGYPL